MKTKSASQSAFFRPRVLIGVFLCAVAACSMVTGTLLAFFQSGAPAKISNRALTFEERVSHQQAIEEVYWRHRIWPKERPDPKPSLDAVMSQAQLEKKVEDYLRYSQALEDYWQRPITGEQLQAEIERMSQHTKQPQVLRELFEALGNDPFVIAECLARPALAERLVTNWYAYDQRIHSELKQRAETDLQAHNTVEEMKQLSGKYSETEFLKTDSARDEDNRAAGHGVKLNQREWNQTVQKLAAMSGEGSNGSVRTGVLNRPVAAGVPPAIKTGVLGPLQEDEKRYYTIAVLSNTDDQLKLATVSWPKEPLESWRARSENQVPIAIAAPNANYMLPAITDGSECIVDTWTATAGPPDGRYAHTAVWTGSEMIVWGALPIAAALSTPVGDIIPARIVGQSPAPRTRRLPEIITLLSGQAVK